MGPNLNIKCVCRNFINKKPQPAHLIPSHRIASATMALVSALVVGMFYVTTLIAYTVHLSSKWEYNYISQVQLCPVCAMTMMASSSLFIMNNLSC